MKTLVSVVSVSEEEIVFSDKSKIYHNHDYEGSEEHFLDFASLSIEQFEGLLFDLSGIFFERDEGVGIKLVPANGNKVAISGFGTNNGWYSKSLYLVVVRGKRVIAYDITECQEISNS